MCQRINYLIKNLKLLDDVSRYNLYYYLTYPLKWKFFGLETCVGSHFLVFFYQIKKIGDIRTRNRLVIKTLIPYQKTNLIQNLKLLNKISVYNLYYYLTLYQLI